MPEKKTEETSAATPAVEELQKSLQEAKSQNDKYQQLLKDPTMQLVLNKMANGEDIKFAEEKTETPKPASMKDKLGIQEPSKDIDLNELSNTDLTNIISESVENYVKDVKDESAKEHQEQWALLKNDLKQTQDALLKVVSQQQVKDVASQHKDFETYRPAMAELSQKYPQMSMEDLYTHVKGVHLMSTPGRQTTETEKPESSSPFPEWQTVQTRSIATGEKEKSVGQSTTALRTGGRKDFLSMVHKAAGRFVNTSNMGDQ